MPEVTPLLSDKGELRLWMRRMRREIEDRGPRSERIWEAVVALTEVHRARKVLVFTTIAGEPEVARFVEWCRADGKDVAVPEDDIDPTWPDVVLVPGLAFTPTGQRLGQGGGWYDRFLPRLRDDAVTIGVAFGPQIVAALPLDDHDVPVDMVVTDNGLLAASSAPNA
jgi:5-formyltetrahydrofolate cyclo-ligase